VPLIKERLVFNVEDFPPVPKTGFSLNFDGKNKEICVRNPATGENWTSWMVLGVEKPQKLVPAGVRFGIHDFYQIMWNGPSPLTVIKYHADQGRCIEMTLAKDCPRNVGLTTQNDTLFVVDGTCPVGELLIYRHH
jgi:hypothetical protein